MNEELKKAEEKETKQPFEYEHDLKETMDYLEEFTNKLVYVLVEGRSFAEIRVAEGRILSVTKQCGMQYWKSWRFSIEFDNNDVSDKHCSKEDIGVKVFFSREDAIKGMKNYYYKLIDEAEAMEKREKAIEKAEEVSE